ncbi:menaquinone biosynthesis family protein [Flavilitoribacter nigricans]|uniref:1,4-dihydroxy-6-naphtoate synthase n=1 Tax=Flavilitoribacter nigricans (strain ATCC 23147 / DSM 23189 / NBRC 102662 / NCIMB 1420 / SS-2) TaxID=1122177 RepID=A0A2D0N9F2_FLAN2|nr:1,4-dihydroxy-6-naphthoate synthase [Flavilitoribacter nigricans]PHN05151.1 1,4-dihydroxy-6-naphthoate synthase [Flavilitoribacter nigricans DSM 23189 = NBRC 102662]
MKLSLGFSPCPNDTFIFDALMHGKIDTEGLTFEVIMEDVEALNEAAFRSDLDITKLSYHAYAYLRDKYVLLDAGSALGNNCGPLLIAKSEISADRLQEAVVAIPGKYTTANFLLGLAYPEITNKKEMLFSDIEGAVLRGEVDAGLIIHENRFTYEDKGLVKIRDLGEYWETTTGMPIPLGGIVIRRDLPEPVRQKVNRVLARSVAFALEQPEQTLEFVRQYAQEMQESVMMAHIGLYVNDYTRDLGERGRAAVQHLFKTADEKGIIPQHRESIFM